MHGAWATPIFEDDARHRSVRPANPSCRLGRQPSSGCRGDPLPDARRLLVRFGSAAGGTGPEVAFRGAVHTPCPAEREDPAVTVSGTPTVRRFVVLLAAGVTILSARSMPPASAVTRASTSAGCTCFTTPRTEPRTPATTNRPKSRSGPDVRAGRGRAGFAAPHPWCGPALVGYGSDCQRGLCELLIAWPGTRAAVLRDRIGDPDVLVVPVGPLAHLPPAAPSSAAAPSTSTAPSSAAAPSTWGPSQTCQYHLLVFLNPHRRRA